MPPLNEEQLHQLRDERKEQIVLAAVKVFARWGISGTKMSMIATEAGISHGLLYHYFKSKDDLFTALVQLALEESYKAVSEVYHFPGSPLEKLGTLTKIILDEENPPFFMLIHHARTSENVPEKAQQLIKQHSMQFYVELLLPLFIEGQQAGEITSDNPQDLITWYFTVLSGIMVVNAQSDTEYRIPTAEVLMRMITAS